MEVSEVLHLYTAGLPTTLDGATGITPAGAVPANVARKLQGHGVEALQGAAADGGGEAVVGPARTCRNPYTPRSS
jgi:hypothetical protein